MSRRPKNNHYHFAEQYSDGHYSRKAKAASRLHLPRRSVFFALLVLLVFGVVTTTFSANISDDNAENGSILISVRNAKADRDLAVTGADAELADTGADVDLAEVAAVSDLRYNSATKGWGTNSSVTGNSSGWIPVSFSSDSNETFKIYHNGWNDAYFSKSAAAVSLNTEYTLNNTSSNPNMTYSFAAGNYGIKIENPDVYNNMKMTIYRLFDANAVLYIDVSDYWSDDNPEIGGYFCDSTSGTATWVRATRCGDISNTHLYKLIAPSSAIYSKLVLGRFSTGTTANQMGFSGSRFYNQSVDIYYQATNTKIKLTSYGSGSTTKATVSTSSVTHTHSYQAYEYTRNTVNDSYSLASTISSGTTVECTTSTISLSATDRSSSGYEFDGWYRGTTAGVDNATTLVSSSLSCTPTNYGGTSYYYAKYTLSSFTITYNSDDTPATATAGEITNPATNGVPASEEKTYGVNYTITSNKYLRNGYTQVGWSTSANSTSTSGAGFYDFGATYSTNAALTLYPVWQLNDPVNTAPGQYATQDPNDPNPSQPKIITTGTMTVGGTVDLALDVASNSPDVTRSYAYSITGPSGNTSSVGVDPTDSTTFMKFTADTPGTYTVYITVTDVSHTGVTNASNTASAVSNTATISVAPDVPQFTITAYNVVLNDGDRDGATSDTAYRILLGDRYYFSAQIDSTYLANHPTSSYTYTWSTDADFAQAHIVGTGSTITFTNTVVPNTSPHQYAVNLINYDPTHTYNNDPDDPAYDPDPRTLADESHGLESVTLYCRVTCNSVSNDSDDHYLWYFIQPLIKSFKYEPMQKIFNLSDQTVTLAAQYNIANDPSYTTRLFFSSSNYGNPWPKALESSGFIEDFTNAIKTYLFPAGTKYFYIEMEGYNSMQELITSVSEKIHTTVGTADSGASRVLYFNNNTAQDLKNYLVMCYYIDGSGALKYQVAQDRNKGDENNEGRNYRVMLPADTSAVRFGFLGRDTDHVRYYGSPTIENGEISGFSVPIYYGYTDQITLNGNSYSVINATASTTTSGMQSFTCTAS